MMGVMIMKSYKMEEVMGFMGMVVMEGCTIALTIMAKTVMSGGMSPFVFVVYSNALSTILLLPYSFLFHPHRTELSLFTLPLLLRFFFLGFTGITLAQNLAFVGLKYSSPIVVCAMGLLIPAFSFLLSLFLRMTKLDWRNPSFQIKVIGTMISVMGATVEGFYRGPFVKKASSSSLHLLQHHINQLFVFYSPPDSWVLGGLLLAASSFCVSVWNNIQLGTVKQHPHVMKIASLYSLAGTFQCAVFSMVVERDPNAWKLRLNMELFLIVVTAIFGGVIRSTVHVYLARMKGSSYVPMFQPFRIGWATFFGVSFFANSLHYGSILGAVICGMGYYTIMWGQIREDEKGKERDIESVNSDAKLPLLKEDQEV